MNPKTLQKIEKTARNAKKPKGIPELKGTLRNAKER